MGLHSHVSNTASPFLPALAMSHSTTLPPFPTHLLLPLPAPMLLLILKWGGELTPAGQRQAEELGRVFRCMYPGGAGEYGILPGSGFLRLHSTYRHDLKVRLARVDMTLEDVAGMFFTRHIWHESW